MKRIATGRLLMAAMKRMHAFEIIGIFVVFFFVVALVIFIVEPGIERYVDALWYCYVNMFTIGFGDIVPVTPAGRIVSVVLTIYATAVIAVVTGVMASLYSSISRHRLSAEELKRGSDEEIIYSITHLEELSPEQLKELSAIIKKHLNE